MFKRNDWLSFGVSTVIALAVYLYTIAPEVTLEWSGMFATSAMYSGVAISPGFPIWTLYGWVFTKMLPFSNIAWRVAVSSAVAGSLTCGVIALMVTRGSAMVLERTRGFQRLLPQEESKLRLVCGVVAGLGFGFCGVFWRFCTVVGPTALGLLLLSVVLCLLLRWGYRPQQTRYLYAAAFLYGLTLTVQLAWAALAPALPLFVLFLRPAVGRDFLVMITAALVVALWGSEAGWLPNLYEEAGQFYGLWRTYLFLAITYGLISIVLVVKSRRLFTQGRAVLITMGLLFCGLLFYLYIAVASMTNPPMNWGYPRTWEGFIHMLSRGQFERIRQNVLDGELRFLQMPSTYSIAAVKSMGWLYVVPSVVPFLFLRRIRGRARSWVLGLMASFLALSLFMLIMLNPQSDPGTWFLMQPYFAASYLVMAILTGCGLVYLATIATPKKASSA